VRVWAPAKSGAKRDWVYTLHGRFLNARDMRGIARLLAGQAALGPQAVLGAMHDGHLLADSWHAGGSTAATGWNFAANGA